jgi:hypothetical protein
VGAEQSDERQFRILVAAGPDPRHHCRPLRFGKNISRARLLPLRVERGEGRGAVSNSFQPQRNADSMAAKKHKSRKRLSLWSAVTCHRFPRFDDSSSKQRRVQRREITGAARTKSERGRPELNYSVWLSRHDSVVWGAHASRVPSWPSRQRLRLTIFSRPVWWEIMERRSSRRDAGNHTPVACAPLLQLNRSGLDKLPASPRLCCERTI